MSKPHYPNSRIEAVTDLLHGNEITDNYRWLEDGGSTQTKAWVAEQNAFSRAYLESCPEREALRAELKQVFDASWMGVPSRFGKRYFYSRREAGQNHAVFYFKDDSLEQPEQIAIDPNTFSSDGTVALGSCQPSFDGKLLAYSSSSAGREIGVLKIKNLETMQDLDLEISPVWFPSVTWLKDSSGFYYSRFPKSGSVPAEEEMYHQAVYFHAFRTNSELDPLVFKPENMVACASVAASSDETVLLLSTSEGGLLSGMIPHPHIHRPDRNAQQI